ncbi:conserved hypothetical protein [Mucor ambiguus]|uniref:Uncharacterized protein n=1 Tax=Mucor ambiguus TaxID=91626 RepID=A0A0C9LS51_9FUNG|nr:conserved hypothetical protein [Mucor ambiguus]
MLRSPKFVWATCLITLVLTMFLVIYTSSQTMSVQLRFNISPVKPATTAPVTTTIENVGEKEEKYITFLPHSGLHNQRIGLINAMVLAKALDRTLILPDINIGSAVWWRATPTAEFRLAECSSIKQRSNPTCKDFTKYVPVSVETVFDLSAIHAAGVRTIQRSSMSTRYFEESLGASEQDIYRLDDNARYSYRIYDSKDNQDDIRTFRYRVDMEDLRQREEKVMLFGSLHYTLRLALQDPYLLWLAQHLREEISIAHPIVVRQALSVIPLLGGPENFVGVHLRQGDGFFKALQDETLNTLRATLEQANLDQAQLEQIKLQQEPLQPVNTPLSPMDQERIDVLKEIDSRSLDKTDLLNQCIAWHSTDNHPRLRLIYMATDTRQPRTTLKALYDEFPCIFTLSDFPQVIESTLTMSPMLTGNQDIDNEMTLLDAKIAPLLFPMIDAEIASHGSLFIGTRKSTFSQYINHRFNRFQKMYHY